MTVRTHLLEVVEALAADHRLGVLGPVLPDLSERRIEAALVGEEEPRQAALQQVQVEIDGAR
jgi:hypothetical protein